MKTFLIVVAVLLLCAALFFLAPHHRRRESSFQPCTLGGIYADFVTGIPDLQTPRIGMILLLALMGIVAAFYPALLVVLTRWRSGGALFVLGGIAALVGAMVNFIVMLVSHMTFGFGASSSSADETPFLVVIPLVQVAFAVLSIVIGASSACAAWAGRVVGP